MKKNLKRLCGFMCLLSVIVFVLSGCDIQNMFGGPVEVPKEDGVTPVYYGMLMSTSPSVEIPSVSYEEAAKGNTNNNGNHNGWYKDNNGNNGNHYGWYKDDNGDGKLDDDFQQQICYVSQNQDVYFYVGIGNPAGLQIVSIKINGKTYTSDMFEKNSTNEVKILKYNVGNAHGIVEYTIEEIATIAQEKVNQRKTKEQLDSDFVLTTQASGDTNPVEKKLQELSYIGSEHFLGREDIIHDIVDKTYDEYMEEN